MVVSLKKHILGKTSPKCFNIFLLTLYKFRKSFASNKKCGLKLLSLLISWLTYNVSTLTFETLCIFEKTRNSLDYFTNICRLLALDEIKVFKWKTHVENSFFFLSFFFSHRNYDVFVVGGTSSWNNRRNLWKLQRNMIGQMKFPHWKKSKKKHCTKPSMHFFVKIISSRCKVEICTKKSRETTDSFVNHTEIECTWKR